MFGRLKKTVEARGRIGVAIRGDHVALAVINRTQQRPTLERCELLPLAAGSTPEAIAGILRGAALPRMPISGVLQADEYRLTLVEAPEVPSTEMRSAIRWRLKDAVDFEIESAVVDVFEVPPQSRGGQGRMMYAVAAERRVVERHAAALTALPGFDAVDVPELCLRNLGAALPTAAQGIALLHLGESSATLILVQGRTFYLARAMELGAVADADQDTTEVDAGGIVLELHRSLDYYERHFDQPPITRVAIAPTGPRATALARRIAEETGFEAAVLDLGELLDAPAELAPRVQAECLMAVGAALREERRTL